MNEYTVEFHMLTIEPGMKFLDIPLTDATTYIFNDVPLNAMLVKEQIEEVETMFNFNTKEKVSRIKVNRY